MEENNEIDLAAIQEDMEQEKNPSYIKMDYSITDVEGRLEKVKEILANTPSERLTPIYLDRMADYLVQPISKEEKKKKKILTPNRMVTVNARETSFEGLVGKFENGEDGIYNMIRNDKNILFKPKVSITEEDKEEIPELKELDAAIKELEEKIKTARGKQAYMLRKQLIEMRKDQYIIKNIYKKPIYSLNILKSVSKINLEEHIFIDKDMNIRSDCLINLFNEEHISALLRNYWLLKDRVEDKNDSDLKWLMLDFNNLIKSTLKEKYPLYYDLTLCKFINKSNAEIQKILYEKYQIKYSIEYISSLWRNKIPKLLVEKEKKDYIDWYYLEKERGHWKKCSRCGKIKLANNLYFSKNKSSRDGFYSICKECRNKKVPKKGKDVK